MLFFMIIILKNNLWSFKLMFFVTKPMVELISFKLKYLIIFFLLSDIMV